jgi:opacity protein-like surface antigen
MNRTRFALVSFVFVLVMAFAAAASATPSVGTFEINAGYAKSSLEVAPAPNDKMGGSLTFGAGYFRSIAPKTSWGIEASYDALGSTDWDTGTAPATTSLNIIRFTPELRMNFGAGVGPSFFAQAGGGLYSVKAKIESTDTAVAGEDTSSKFGFNAGAGVGFPMGPKTRLNIQGNYHSVSTEGKSTNYMGARAGIALGL